MDSEPTFSTDLQHHGDAATHEHEDRLKAHLHELIDSANPGASLDNDDTKATSRRSLNLGVVDRVADETLVVPALRRRLPLDLTSPAVETAEIGREQFDRMAVQYGPHLLRGSSNSPNA